MNLAALFALLFVLLLLTGTLSHEDEVIAERMYCENVRDGIHPDFKGIAGEACVEKNPD